MKILVIMTGGTIGSKSENGTISVADGSAYRLIEMYYGEFGMKNRFVATAPLNILSENLTAEHWRVMANAVGEGLKGDFDGIILTHGSDTLSYTSAMMGLLFRGADIPIVITAANKPLDDVGSNGFSNFKTAAALIESRRFKGVFTVFRSNSGHRNVYLPQRISEAHPFSDEFSDFFGAPLCRLEHGEWVFSDSPYAPQANEIAERKQTVISDYNVEFTKSVLMLRPYPGLDYGSVMLSENTAAVLHCLYHSGTACTASDYKAHSVLGLIDRCKEKGVPFYIVSVKKNGGRYATLEAMEKAGARALYDMPFEAAYAMLTLAYNQKEIAAEKLLKTVETVETVRI